MDPTTLKWDKYIGEVLENDVNLFISGVNPIIWQSLCHFSVVFMCFSFSSQHVSLSACQHVSMSACQHVSMSACQRDHPEPAVDAKSYFLGTEFNKIGFLVCLATLMQTPTFKELMRCLCQNKKQKRSAKVPGYGFCRSLEGGPTSAWSCFNHDMVHVDHVMCWYALKHDVMKTLSIPTNSHQSLLQQNI